MSSTGVHTFLVSPRRPVSPSNTIAWPGITYLILPRGVGKPTWTCWPFFGLASEYKNLRFSCTVRDAENGFLSSSLPTETIRVAVQRIFVAANKPSWSYPFLCHGSSSILGFLILHISRIWVKFPRQPMLRAEPSSFACFCWVVALIFHQVFGSNRPDHCIRGAQSTDGSYAKREEAVNYLPGGEVYRQMLGNASDDNPRREASVSQWLREWERKWEFSGAQEHSPP